MSKYKIPNTGEPLESYEYKFEAGEESISPREHVISVNNGRLEPRYSPLDLSLISCENCTNISPRHTYKIENDYSDLFDTDTEYITTEFKCKRCGWKTIATEYPIKD